MKNLIVATGNPGKLQEMQEYLIGLNWKLKLKPPEIEIEEIETIKNKDINELKILLANKTTEMLHGKEAAKSSEQAAKEAFSGNTLGSNLPKVNIQSNKIEEKINIVDLVLLSKLENSKSEIRRLINGNAVKINDDVISDEKFEINKNLFKDNYLKLSLGKKRHIKIELN